MATSRETANYVFDRPKMYGLDGSYANFVIALIGYNLGWRDRDGDSAPLGGFTNWLASRLGFGTNLVWWVLVLRLAIPDIPRGTDIRDLSAEQEQLVVNRLRELLEEFLDSTQSLQS